MTVVTLEDRRAVYALLDRYLDWLPPARLSVGRAEGPVKVGVGRWRRCEACDGEGRVLGEGKGQRPCRQAHPRWPSRHGCRPCPVGCERGFVRLHGRAAESGADPMINSVKGKSGVDVTASYERAERRAWVDSELVKLEALQRQHAGVEAAPDDWTRAHDAKRHQWRTGSFAALESALFLLQVEQPLRFAVLRVYVIERQFPMPDRLRFRMDETVDWLAARMPADILLPQDAKEELAKLRFSLEHGRDPRHLEMRRARDEQIVELVVEHGWSLRRVGKKFDLSHVRVGEIVRGAAGVRAVSASGPAA